MFEGLDSELEKMILQGIKQEKYYTSKKMGGKLRYRAISDLEERDALDDMINELGIETRVEYDTIFGEDEEKDLEEGKERQEPPTFYDKLFSIGLSPVRYASSNLAYNIAVIYHGIKDYYASFSNRDELKCKQIISFFHKEDIDKLSGLILDISGATEENQERLNKFPDRYAKASADEGTDKKRVQDSGKSR